MSWTFSPVDAIAWNRSDRRVLFLGPEPNGDGQTVTDMGAFFRQQQAGLSLHPFVRMTLLHLFGVRCPAQPAPRDAAGEINYKKIAAEHLPHMRYCDIKASPGGNAADFEEVCAWYQANQGAVQGFWTGAGDFAPPHITVVHGAVARDIFVQRIRHDVPAPSASSSPIDSGFVVMFHPSARGIEEGRAAEFVTSMSDHIVALPTAGWWWSKCTRTGEFSWNGPYVRNQCLDT